ncbi:related to PAB-dependent poly(A)-specific ribonuclease subunit pan3 [Lecanosticta acicola]|uniref:PAN2-PAN3 deadenylation complex subunit PAN3 n=1 Tax=Lecanosticta acicola TaxID=111012 RepID=A0AAI8Z0L2_9PEZI|nr:related to PAB-dependent poly(A)-specific ribonuclease subunit pan3 [Lecanosticta acicola]
MPPKRRKFISLSEHEALTEPPSADRDQPRAVSNPLLFKNAYPVEVRPRRNASDELRRLQTERLPSGPRLKAAELQALHETLDTRRPAQNPPHIDEPQDPPDFDASPSTNRALAAHGVESAIPEKTTNEQALVVPRISVVPAEDLPTNVQPPNSNIERAVTLTSPVHSFFQGNLTAEPQSQLSILLSGDKEDNPLTHATDSPLLDPKEVAYKDGGTTQKPITDRSKSLPHSRDHHPQGSDDMANASFRMSGDGRRSNRYENRPPASSILCRNGPQCRKYQEGTCNYNHDFGNSMALNGANNISKKSLNVDSPAFTPKIGHAQLAKVGISPKAAAAAAFTPRGSGSVTPATNTHSKDPSADFSPSPAFQPTQQAFQEFFPSQPYLGSQQTVEPHANLQAQLHAFDPYAQQGIAGLDPSQTAINPYAQQAGHAAGQPFFQDSSAFRPQPNYHLYASIGPRRDNLMPNQRSTTDFFMPDDLREDLQRKAEATLQTFANSTLPRQLEHFHSLVALDTNSSRGPATFGYPSWIYKATSARDGHTYALRRIEGFRLNSEAAIRTVATWKRITNASLVQIHDAFTTRVFDDSSLVVVTAYHPCSQTLAEKHFGKFGSRQGVQITPEVELWGYVVQLASALKTIHDQGLAAQTVVASKVLVTSKNRVRLNGCAVLDVLLYEQRKPVEDLQRADMVNLGRLVMSIAARNPNASQNAIKSLELISRTYSERLRSLIAWLLAPPSLSPDTPQQQEAPASQYNINTLLSSISDKVLSVFDGTLHRDDEMTSTLMGELENGRLVRLMAKLNVILERPDQASTLTAGTNPALVNNSSSAWSEIGDRFYLKLFRDYVFHQVDAEGRPVIDLGHIITCLNKLDAGIDENIQLITRDEQNMMIVSYKEVKRCFETVWSEIYKASSPARR